MYILPSSFIPFSYFLLTRIFILIHQRFFFLLFHAQPSHTHLSIHTTLEESICFPAAVVRMYNMENSKFGEADGLFL